MTDSAPIPAGEPERSGMGVRGAHSVQRRTLGVLITAIGIMLVAANLRPPVVSVAPLVDGIMQDLGLRSAAAGLLTTLPVLFFGLSAPFAPRLAARFGIERTVFGAVAVLIGGMGLRFVPNVLCLFAGSAVIGAAIGVCNVVLPAVIKRDFAHRSGLMTGLYSMTLSGGAAVAAGLTVPIDQRLDGNWQLTLMCWTLPAVVALIIWVPQLRQARRVVVARTPPTALLRNRIAWAITVYMGAQSLIFYTFTAWLPQYLVDQGRSSADAGTILALGQIVALSVSLVVPIVAGRRTDQRWVSLLVVAVCAIGFVGLLGTDNMTTLWVMLVMSGPGASISLALLFMVVRSPSTVVTGQVSGMAQSVGYVVAAMGPFLIGALRDATGSWTVAMSALALALVPQGVAALTAARDVTMRV